MCSCTNMSVMNKMQCVDMYICVTEVDNLQSVPPTEGEGETMVTP